MDANQEFYTQQNLLSDLMMKHDKQKLKEFTKRKPTVQNILSKIFHEEEMKNDVNQQWEELA